LRRFGAEQESSKPAQILTMKKNCMKRDFKIEIFIQIDGWHLAMIMNEKEKGFFSILK
jgi:hypothetical protein